MKKKNNFFLFNKVGIIGLEMQSNRASGPTQRKIHAPLRSSKKQQSESFLSVEAKRESAKSITFFFGLFLLFLAGIAYASRVKTHFGVSY
jgi:hypothetical protein